MNSIDPSVKLSQLHQPNQPASREWVKPTLERLPLKDALAGLGDDDDGVTSGTS